MAFIRSAKEIAEKYSRVTPLRTDDYRKGVESPRADWDKQAIAAKDNYKAAIQDSLTRGAFEKGVAKAGQAKWQNKTLLKGPARFAEGVSVSGPDFEEGFAPYQDAIAKVTLPPRYPAGDPRNIERVKAVSTALRQVKVGA